MRIRTSQLNLLVIRAADPRRLCRFYEALGFEFVEEQHGSSPIHHASKQDDWVFEIYPRQEHEPATVGTRLGFKVSSLQAAVDALSDADGALLSGPKMTSFGNRAVFQDPEGHKVELIEERAGAVG